MHLSKRKSPLRPSPRKEHLSITKKLQQPKRISSAGRKQPFTSLQHLLSLDSFHSIAYLFRRVKASGGIFCGDGQESETVSPASENLPAISFALLYNRNLYCIIVSLRTRIHNHSPPSERVFCRAAALKNLAIHKVLSAFFRLAGQQNPSPIRHPLIMNTGSKRNFPNIREVLKDNRKGVFR